jgi:diguanylate cyclase (GGDEF)-like protein
MPNQLKIIDSEVVFSMFWERYLIFIILIASGGITGNLALSAQKRNKNATGKVFGFLLLAMTIYSCGYACELISNTLPMMRFWSNFQYLGIVCISPLWIILALLYNGLEKWLTRSILLLLFLIPALTFLIHFTNLGHLYYTSLTVNRQGPFPTFAPHLGPWYWVMTVYQDLSLLVGILFFLLMGRRENPFYHQQVSLIIVGVAFPLFGHLINLIDHLNNLSGHSHWNLDLAPLALTLSAVLAYWGFYSFRLFDIVPIARTKVFESIHDGVLVLDLQNRIVDVNTAVNRMLNLPATSLGLNIDQVLSDYPQLIRQLLSRAEQTIIQIETEGKNHYLESKLSRIDDSFGHMIGYTVILTDKSEQILLFNELQTLATIDSLTAVYNRRYFFEVCLQKLVSLQQSRSPVAFILIDLDHFKEINDTYGHQTGDIVLKQASANLMSALSGQSILGRVGGEEFAVLLPKCDLSKASMVAEQLRASVDTFIAVNERQIHLTASFGVSGREHADTNVDLLFGQADEALYRSKDKGRNKVTAFSGPSIS